MEKKFKVLGIGEVVLDKSNLLSKFPTEGQKNNSISTTLSVGGPVSAALILLSRLGVECQLVCSIANDEAGKIIKNKLEKEGIKIIPHLQSKTKTNLIIVDQQTASRTIIKDQINHQPIQHLSETLIKSVDLIICDRHEELAFNEVLNKKNKETPIVIDPSTEISKKILKMIKAASHPILPIESLHIIDPSQNLRNNLKKIQKIANKEIVITAGKLGSFSFDGKKIKFAPAYEIKAIDTLGAGDVYRGAYSYGILNNWQQEKILDFANLVSALQCIKIGNGSAIPSIREVESFKKVAKLKKNSLLNINFSLKGKLL